MLTDHLIDALQEASAENKRLRERIRLYSEQESKLHNQIADYSGDRQNEWKLRTATQRKLALVLRELKRVAPLCYDELIERGEVTEEDMSPNYWPSLRYA